MRSAAHLESHNHREVLPDDIDVVALFRTGAEWLEGRADAAGWSHVWQFLLEHREALPDDIDAAGLFRTGAEWLKGREDAPDWSFVWQALWIAAKPLGFKSESNNLLQSVREWLLLPPNQDRGEWDKLFETVIDAGYTDENLLQAGARWTVCHLDQPQVPILVRKLLTAAPTGTECLDSLAGWLAQWLAEHSTELSGSNTIRTLVKRGLGSEPTLESETLGRGWLHLIEFLYAFTLSIRRFIESYTVGQTIHGIVRNRVKGGYLVQIDDEDSIMAFLPQFQAIRPSAGDWDALVGTTAEFEITKLDKESPTVVISQRVGSVRDALDHLTVGQVIEGSISNIKDYGLFVNVGSINGLLHRTKLIDQPDGDLHNRFKEGQSIWVQVKKVDHNKRRIALAQVSDPESAREQQSAARGLLNSLTVGQVIEGPIKDIVDYGLFVDVGGITGLLHRSKLIDPSEGDLNERYQPKQPILVEVIDVDLERQRIGLREVAR